MDSWECSTSALSSHSTRGCEMAMSHHPQAWQGCQLCHLATISSPISSLGPAAQAGVASTASSLELCPPLASKQKALRLLTVHHSRGPGGALTEMGSLSPALKLRSAAPLPPELFYSH